MTEKKDTISHSLIVFADSGADIQTAELLAKRLRIDMTKDKSDAEQVELMLRLDADGLAIRYDCLGLPQSYVYV